MEDIMNLRRRPWVFGGQPVEQVVQWTGLPQETVQALAAQLN
jgi:hypothetical protein